MDEVIGDEDKVLILLSSLPNEGFETFVLILINEKSYLSYNKVTTALVNLKLRRKDNKSFNCTPAEVERKKFKSKRRKSW